MIVATSAHPVDPPAFGPSTFGITNGTLPSGCWSAATSFNHFTKKLCDCILNVAVLEKACASPVHPKRSSRCGQSVGTSKKLPFCPHWILCCNWFNKGLEH